MLELRFLGRFGIRLHGSPVLLPSRPAQSLLAYLVLSAGTAHRREKLAGLLWPEADEANARSNLRHALWRIRKAIEPDDTGATYLVTDDLAVSFNASADYSLDVTHLTRGGDALPDLLNTLEHYRGELLPGFYDEWVTLERERVEAVFQHKMQRLLDRLVEDQRWSDVLEWGERWVAQGHAPEPAYRALMLAHAEVSDRSRVTAVYQRCREALLNELGVEPSVTTRRLYERLRREEGEPPGASEMPMRRAAVLDEAPAPGEPPFQGLRYFDEGDADRFFGRERMTERLVRRLQSERFVAVLGASGSGKSSVARAGMAPALRSGWPALNGHALNGQASDVRILTPTTHPLEALAASLLGNHGADLERAALLDELARDRHGLRRFLQHHADRRRPSTQRVLLIVDQFEELFSLCEDAFEREAFVENLLTAAAAPDHLASVVIALRADFYAHCAQYASLREAVAEHQEYVGPMSGEELRRAIEGPAAHGGWSLESGLVNTMLRDVGEEPAALPLLSHALLETWRRRRGHRLTLAGYAESGGVQGAIAQTAESVFVDRLTGAQRPIARRIFLQLTELGDGTQDTRRRMGMAEMVPHGIEEQEVRAVLQVLADVRLVTLHERTVEVAHEALIRQWPRLREWLTQDREGLRLHRQLNVGAREWERLHRDAGLLYRGVRLEQALEWASEHFDDLDPSERLFLNTSRELAVRERSERESQHDRELQAAQTLAETQRRSASQLRQRALFLAAALVLALGMGAAALFFGEQAQDSARTAFSRELAASAISNLDVDPERSILLALQGVAGADPSTPEAETALHLAVQASRARLTLRGHSDRVLDVSFNPDGTRLVTTSRDRSAKVWDAESGVELLTLAGHAGEVDAASFSPDGKRIATASLDHTARLWDATTGAELGSLTGHADAVRGLAFSPDGEHVATASTDGTARVWDATTGLEILRLAGDTQGLLAIAYSPDGRHLITGGQDNVARVWDVTTGENLLTLSGHTGEIAGVAFSPDGNRIATSGGDFTVRVWDAASGQMIQTLSRPCYVQGVAFSPDNTSLAVADYCGNAAVLDSSTGTELFNLRGHTTAIFKIAFSQDGKRLATASADNSARVWDATPGGNELLTLAGHTSTVFDVKFSPDGSRIGTASWDDTARVWDATSGAELFKLTGHTDQVNALAFSPDGTRLATASGDNTARIWDSNTGEERSRVSGGEQPLLAPQFTVGRLFTGLLDVMFSPEGARLVTAGADGTARIWDVATGRQLVVLRGHRAPVNSAAFSLDGTRIATASDDETARVWDASTGQELLTLSGQTQRVWRVAFSPNGKRLATSSTDGSPHVWDLATGQPLFTLRGQSGTIQITYSQDGARLATPAADGTVKVWDAMTGRELLTLQVPGGGVTRSAFSPDASRLVAGTRNDTARVYVLDLPDLLDLAHARLTRPWTLDECQRYLHREQCPA